MKTTFDLLQSIHTTLIFLTLSKSLLFFTGCADIILARAVYETHRDADLNFKKAEQYREDNNLEQAIRHYRFAANGGHALAAYTLGTYYLHGIGTEPNIILARRYFVQTVRIEDHTNAYLQLADIDFHGKGRPRAVIQGYKWMLIATRDDNKLRKQYQQTMDAEMTPAYITKAHSYAQKWLKAHKRN